MERTVTGVVVVALFACSDSGGDSIYSNSGGAAASTTSSGDGDGDGDGGSESDGDGDPGSEGDSGDSEAGDGDPGDAPHPLWVSPNLWYSVEDLLTYIELDPADGSVVQIVTSTISTPLVDGQTGLTMLEDGSLLGSRERLGATQVFHIPDPPTQESTIPVTLLGVVPNQLRVEALYTGCGGDVYLMDTGSDVTDAVGNRLLRFTGDYLDGDLGYEVITDLQMAQVADIDDMAPGIDAMGEVSDALGYAIDSGDVYTFDYTTGTGNYVGTGGTWGIHVLGGPLFDDGVARLYLLDEQAALFEASPVDISLSPVLATGPAPAGGADPGWSGLAGPLTECITSFPIPNMRGEPPRRARAWQSP